MHSYQPASSMSGTANLPKQHVIQVFGEGVVTVQPDMAIITVGVVTESKNLSEAQQANSTTMTKVIQSLLQLGIPNENIKTTDYSIDTLYDYESGKQIFRGYRVTHLLQVKINQIALTGQVVDVAVNNGANSISSIHFTASHSDVYYNQALALAIRNAQQKAHTISQTLGVPVNLIPTKVTETPQALPPTPIARITFATAGGTPIEAGQLQIKATIVAQFSLDFTSEYHSFS